MAHGPERRPDERWALFLDFDGTLVEIADRPDGVVVEPALPGHLARVRDRLGGALALVSGRPIAVLDGFLGPERFDAAGLHGIEHRIGGRLFPCRIEDHPTLRRGVLHLGAALAALDGVLLEDKGCSVAVHWRLAPQHADAARDAASALARELGSDYRLQEGKAVAEILPARAGKGQVIRTFLNEPPYEGRRPIFIGDDLTDEHGFEAVNALGGVSVRIGPGESVATVRISSPAALRERLRSWAAGERMSLGDLPG